MEKLTPTGRARGPLEMHHAGKPAPELTTGQRGVIDANRRRALARTSRPSTTAEVDPFAILDPVESDPF